MNHVLAPLPYDVGALEPYIDARTMALHHDKHHAGYVEKLRGRALPEAARSIDHYEVAYEFRGVQHFMQTAVPPGPTVAVNERGEPRG
jgi:Fe-Mn family superoxide dismutase